MNTILKLLLLYYSFNIITNTIILILWLLYSNLTVIEHVQKINKDRIHSMLLNTFYYRHVKDKLYWYNLYERSLIAFVKNKK